LATGIASFENTAFHILVASLVATPVAMLTGPYNWWLNYAGKWSKIIVIKLFGSLTLIIMILALFLWRQILPSIMLEPSDARNIYLLLSLSLPPVVTVLGWFGAKMTFPH
jgi:uncharacterized membrane protein